ncbi:MAG: hypothetical protein HOD92_20855 [Deltaproteobacteria bacterium]|jgi:hypothetical protein|nr:hypothetical protein [Deltaproteobacteria bacterium]
MKLYQCKLGEIVCNIQADGTIDKIGHISGLTKNNYEEVIPLVHWVGDKKPQPVHYRNVHLLEDGEKKAEKVKKLKKAIK